ncbi:MAG TPA: tRNA (adenosine(37)-N6)-dimethylallyltransferase MiaA [Candidatus Omnitrophota bacterium]|nr:tRNA (adenosine(37)-N6)-dimethylallyltransferase MiaA [Candidatus Omnitrophota bacterium]
MKTHKIIFIVGPTAVGKSDVAVTLAKRIKGEIVSCDSMQIYKEINIANNKPSLKELKEIPHHLINVVSVEDEFDVARFGRLARNTIEDIHSRGAVPIVVAGSGLYMQILLDGIFEAKGKDAHFRDQLKKRMEEDGVEALYNDLRQVDPAAAGKIHPNDARRIIRALEVFETSRKPISQLQQKREGLWGKYDISIFGLMMPRDVLYQRINERVERMFKAGMVKEIKGLSNLKLSLTARHLIGIKEVLNYFNGGCDLATAAEEMKQNTRRFAKRQMTWFRKDKRIQWIEIGNGQPLDEAVSIILKEAVPQYA